MFVEHIVREATGDPAGMRILDVCAAPGGKTTLLSTLAGLDGVVVANEPIRQRTAALVDNVQRWGLGNVAVTCADPSHFAGFEHCFDIILVDVPCSGEGMMRKNPEAAAQWSQANVELCAGRQRRILADVWDALKPGGLLIYSTCTFNRRENEDNVRWLAQQHDCEGAAVAVDPAWGIVAGEESGIPTFRFFPHRTRSEGFFAAAVRKGDARLKYRVPKPVRTPFGAIDKGVLRESARYVAQPEFMRFEQVGEAVYGYYRESFGLVKPVSESLAVIYSGVRLGQFFGRKFRPDHPLALFHDLAPDRYPKAELTLDQAQDYLRKGDIEPGLLAEGINLVACDGLPIGWIKRIGNRTNNMLPAELRIRNL